MNIALWIWQWITIEVDLSVDQARDLLSGQTFNQITSTFQATSFSRAFVGAVYSNRFFLARRYMASAFASASNLLGVVCCRGELVASNAHSTTVRAVLTFSLTGWILFVIWAALNLWMTPFLMGFDPWLAVQRLLIAYLYPLIIFNIEAYLLRRDLTWIPTGTRIESPIVSVGQLLRRVGRLLWR